jgi:hypothetical protein
MPKIAAEADLSPRLWAEIEMAHDDLAGAPGPFKAAALGNPRRGPEALSRSERTLMRTQALLKVMRRHRMGIPGGHLMDLALSEKPPGHADWPGIRRSDFRPEVVWPYIAKHLGILEHALGLRPDLSWSPVLSPLRALATLAYLPALPASVVPGVEAVLRSGTKAQKRRPRRFFNRFLDGVRGDRSLDLPGLGAYVQERVL